MIRGTGLSVSATAFTLALAMLAGQTVAYAAGDKAAPTAPGNLRVTGLTQYTVSLAWDASKDRSGIASYTICCAGNNLEIVSGSVTSHTYTKGLEANRQFTLHVVARDNAGNYSKSSNTVAFTTPPDTTPPTKPTVTVTDVGPSWISLAWSSIEDGPNVWFTVYMDSNAVLSGSRETSKDFGPLQPETTHTFVVQARDFANQLSPLSDPVTVTTEPHNTSDTTPPTSPGLYVTIAMPDGETWLSWNASTDDNTPSSMISYLVYVNGVFDQGTLGYTQAVVYGVPFSRNTYSVIAVDASGNRSAPVTIEVDNF